MIRSELNCHGCGYRMDAAECLLEPDAALSKGDLSICINCGMLYEYQDPGWRRLLRRERRALDKKTKIGLARMEFSRRQVITQDLAFEQAYGHRP